MARELMRDCNDLINGIEADLALSRWRIKGSKCNKGSKDIKELRQLINDCDILIIDLESDLSLRNRSRRVDISKNVIVKKKFECAELV